MQDNDLDRLLALAARDAPKPSSALTERVLADALAAQPLPRPARPTAAPGRPGFLARLAEAFGGAPVLAGMAGAAVLGLALGYSNPAAFDLLTGTAGAQSLDLFPDTDFLTTEG